MSLAQVDRAWGTRLEVVNLSYTSSTSGYAPLCLGPTHGVAYFYGLGEPTTLSALWFFAGVQTGAHIHIGSTLTALRRAYGRRLTPESLGDGDRAYWLVRQEQPPRRALEFIVPAPEPGHPRIVTRIAFGYKADLEHQDHDIGGIRC